MGSGWCITLIPTSRRYCWTHSVIWPSPMSRYWRYYPQVVALLAAWRYLSRNPGRVGHDDNAWPIRNRMQQRGDYSLVMGFVWMALSGVVLTLTTEFVHDRRATCQSHTACIWPTPREPNRVTLLLYLPPELLSWGFSQGGSILWFWMFFTQKWRAIFHNSAEKIIFLRDF